MPLGYSRPFQQSTFAIPFPFPDRGLPFNKGGLLYTTETFRVHGDLNCSGEKIFKIFMIKIILSEVDVNNPLKNQRKPKPQTNLFSQRGEMAVLFPGREIVSHRMFVQVCLIQYQA